jgi:DNA-binding CsgD family transcriptional regulator
MARLDAVTGALLALYGAAREMPIDVFQDGALAIVRKQVAFTSAQWGSGSQNTEWISKRHVHLYNERPDAAALYENVKEQDVAVKLAWQRRKGLFSYDISEMMGGRACAGIREYANRVEHRSVLLAFDIDVENAFTKWISLYRANDRDRFTSAECRLATLLSPHLWEALAINRLTQLEHISGKDVERRFELAICDREGHLVHAERGFVQLMREEFGMGLGASLPEACMRSLLVDGRYRGRVAVVSVAQRADVLFVKARTLRNVDRLSSRERQIAGEVVLGRSHKAIARQLRVAPATVRNHIQAIHAKLGVHNAAELARELRDAT